MSWQTRGSSLCRLGAPDPDSVEFSRVFEDFIASRGPRGRRKLVASLFSVLGAAGATTVTELSGSGPSDWARILSAASELAMDDRECIERLVGSLAGTAANQMARPLLQKIERAFGIGSAAPRVERGNSISVSGLESACDSSDRKAKRRWSEYISLSEMRVFRRRRRRRHRGISLARVSDFALRASPLRGAAAIALGVLIASNAGLSVPVVCLVLFSCGILFSIASLARFAFLALKDPARADARDLVRGGFTAAVCAAVLLARPVAALLFNILAGTVLVVGGTQDARRLVGKTSLGIAAISRALLASAAIVSGVLLLVDPLSLDAREVTVLAAVLIAGGALELIETSR